LLFSFLYIYSLPERHYLFFPDSNHEGIGKPRGKRASVFQRWKT